MCAAKLILNAEVCCARADFQLREGGFFVAPCEKSLARLAVAAVGMCRRRSVTGQPLTRET